jgi:predicted ATPase/class 3 adenylate cyclase/Tfp pilus assembly protein PilF
LADSLSFTVTFLFTDIEGSSRMWELDPAAMTVALRLHNRIVSQTVLAHRGKLFKSMGDAFCCAFEDAADATRATIAAQIELGRQTWPASTGALRVRMGLHTGAATYDENDYFGSALNRVARIMSSAHGGQIVVSAATVAVLGVPPEGVAFRDLGVKRLKDLDQPERLYQIVAEGLSTQFPPLRTLDEHPNNLPTQLSSFVGRRAELDRVATAFATSRVVTIAGPGGIGKTRLALQFASEATERFPGGVFLVELADVTDRILVPHAVAAAFGLAENGAERVVETIARFVADKSLLLVVDNSEHLLAEVASLIKTLASSCPNLSVLVTSREPLHLTGERVERLTQMSLPERIDASELETSDGCRLFLERARAAGSDGIDVVRDAEAIIAICRRLEGIPLAIEIAASRTATLAPKKLAERLDAHLLVNKDPTVTERHRTLAKAIEWSFRLLEENEKRAFVAMSVFRGGCTADALAAVAGFDAEMELESLLDKSLVYEAAASDDEPRYRFSDPTREFALSERALVNDDLERRHRDYFASIIVQREEPIEDCHRRISADIDNVRAALDWSLQQDSNSAAQLVLSLTSYWRVRSAFTEARLWLNRVRLMERSAPAAQADVARYYASFAVMQDDYENAKLFAEKALAAYRGNKAEFGMGAALHTLAEVAHRRTLFEDADRLYAESFEHLSAANNLIGMTTCLSNRGLLARHRGDFDLARSLLQRAAELAARLGNANTAAQITIERAWLAISEARAEDATDLFSQALKAKTDRDEAHGMCQAQLGLATAYLMQDRAEEAEAVFETALRGAHKLGARIFIADALYGMAAALVSLGKTAASATCYALAQEASAEFKLVSREDFARKLAERRLPEGVKARTSRPVFHAAGAYRDPDAVISLTRSLGS